MPVLLTTIRGAHIFVEVQTLCEVDEVVGLLFLKLILFLGLHWCTVRAAKLSICYHLLPEVPVQSSPKAALHSAPRENLQGGRGDGRP